EPEPSPEPPSPEPEPAATVNVRVSVTPLMVREMEASPPVRAVNTCVCGSTTAIASAGASATAPIKTPAEPLQFQLIGHATSILALPGCAIVGSSDTVSPADSSVATG